MAADIDLVYETVGGGGNVPPSKSLLVDYPIWRKNKISQELGQTCKACGRRDKLDFHVPDEIWNWVVLESLNNHVVCLSCFDEFANEKEIDYSPYLRVLYFVGDRAACEFRAVSRSHWRLLSLFAIVGFLFTFAFIAKLAF